MRARGENGRLRFGLVLSFVPRSAQKTKGTANFLGRKWELEIYEKRAKERQRLLEEAVEKGADATTIAEEIVGKMGLGSEGTVDELQERAIQALAATKDMARPDRSDRAYLQGRKYRLDLDSVANTRRLVTDATPQNQTTFYCPVTKVKLRSSLQYLDHINGRRYQRALGFSMRTERSSLSDVERKLQELAESKRSGASTARAGLTAEEARAELERRLAAREAQIAESRALARARKRGRAEEGGDGDDGDGDGDGDASAARPRLDDASLDAPSSRERRSGERSSATGVAKEEEDDEHEEDDEEEGEIDGEIVAIFGLEFP